VSTAETTKGQASAGPGAAQRAAEEAGLWLKGPARHAAAILCALVVAGSAVMLWKGLEGPKQLDSGVKLRGDGGPVAVYNLADGGDRIHWLKPGDTVWLDTSKPMPRLPVHVDVDGSHHQAFIEEKDFDAGDLSRARDLLKAYGY
jgi:hypothetical protein